MNIMDRISAMLEDLRDANDAIQASHRDGVIQRCGCGAVTLNPPCPKCRREKAEKELTEKEAVRK